VPVCCEPKPPVLDNNTASFVHYNILWRILYLLPANSYRPNNIISTVFQEISVIILYTCIGIVSILSFVSIYTCSHALLGMCLHGLGQYYLIVGHHREAGEAFSEAVSIAREVYSQEDIQVHVHLLW
jgi:hypothetical protein